MISLIRERLVLISDRLALGLHSLGVSPDSSTVLGFLFAAASGLLLYVNPSGIYTFLVAPLLILISGFFDVMDGALARLGQRVTRFGGLLDSTLDRLGEILILSGIILGGLSSLTWGLVAVSSSLMVSYVRARAEVEGIKMSGVGVAERPERILVLVAALLLRSVEYGIVLVGLLSCFTLVQRVLYAYRKLR
ncbi:MAG: CDP-alcohol phosphatidyltransferase family protein [Candidatus Bathyarchaeia archaeon]